MVTRLAEWLAATKTPQADLAKAVGTTQDYVSRLASGRRTRPSAAIAYGIQTATRGGVPVSCWGEEREPLGTGKRKRRQARSDRIVSRSRRSAARDLPQNS